MCHDWDSNSNLLRNKNSNTPHKPTRPIIFLYIIFIFNNNVNSYNLIIKKIRQQFTYNDLILSYIIIPFMLIIFCLYDNNSFIYFIKIIRLL